MNKGFKSLAALGIASVLLLSACSTGGKNVDNRTTASSDENTSTQSHQSSKRVVVDQRDKQVEIPVDVKAIASAVIPAPTLISALDGSWGRIVGVNQALLKSNKEGLMAKIFPESVSTPVVSDRTFTPNMETLLKLNPDVFIQWGDRAEDIIAPVEEAGIASVGLQYGTQEDLETWVKIFGDLLSKPQRAQEFLDYMHQEEKVVSEGVKALNKPKVRGIQASITPEKITVDSSDRYGQHVFDIAGIENMGEDISTQDSAVSVEQILEWDPEIIFLSSFDETTPQDIYDDPRFADVTAVKDKRVYRAPLGAFRWQVPCEEAPLYWHFVAALAYPGEYQVDLPGLTKEKIKWLYNYDMSEEDYQKTLRTDINGVSANYDAVTS